MSIGAARSRFEVEIFLIYFLFFSDLQDIGIVSASEQKHLIEQARILHASKSRPVGYSQRCEMSLERGTIIGVWKKNLWKWKKTTFRLNNFVQYLF